MKIYIIYIFIIFIPNVKLYLLQNHNKKICADCKFFIPNGNKCSKFGDLDIISGKHNFENAIIVRNDENKCGEDAIFFKNNNFKFMSIIFDFLVKNDLSIILYGYFTFLFSFMIIVLYSIISYK